MIRCMIIDDKPLALELLEGYVLKTGLLQLVHKATNPLEGIDWVRAGKVDLIFLDIQMPELSGLDFISLTKNSCSIILTTAYSEYALKGYEYDVVDYLLKPISFERFYKAVLKVAERENVLSKGEAQPGDSSFMFVKTAHKIKPVRLSDITFIEGMQNYVAIHTTKEKVITLQSMKSMEQKLPFPDFIRVHKSYVVAMNKIEEIENNCVIINKQTIPIGPMYKDKFYKQINAS